MLTQRTANTSLATKHARRHNLPAALLLGAALSIPALLTAQAPIRDQAPLASAVTNSTTLFLGNAGDQENADYLRAYDDFYSDTTKLGRFHFVADPSQAQLVLELHYEIDLGQALASNDSHHSVRQFRLVLIDPHTHTVLWSLTERTNYALLQSNRNKNLDETVAKLVSDFADLTAAQPPNNKSKVIHPFIP